MTHLGDRIAALVDGELGHQDRDRALAHVAHCARCRQELDEQRAVRALLAGSAAPAPSARTVEALLSLAAPGGPLPPRARTMPQGPLVPELPPPGRFGRTGARPPRGSRDPQRAANRADSRRPGDAAARRERSAGRGRLVAASALSVAGLVLGTAFVAGGTENGGGPVVTPVAQLTVEHGRTATAVTVGDPAFGLTAGLTGFPSGVGEPTPSGR
jgi:hypothetical protein